jgi:hypothetical protein
MKTRTIALSLCLLPVFALAEGEFVLVRDGAVFPPLAVATMADISSNAVAALAAAQRGERIMAAPLFDGTNDDGVQDSTTTILSGTPPRDVGRFPALSALPSWRMNVAFFAASGGTGAPDYEVVLRYWANGVADDLTMNFGDFAVDGKMVEFELVPPRC